jgi:uncharacterized protein YndB with AHSA1/START domain
MEFTKPFAKAELLIRKPVAEVFQAFIDPEITTRFWFTRSSGKLEAGKSVDWHWDMYDLSAQVNVKTIEENRRIVLQWAASAEPTTAELTFTPYKDDNTFVSITESGWTREGDELLKTIVGTTEGWTLVLAALKSYLEHQVILTVIEDRFPKGLAKHA